MGEGKGLEARHSFVNFPLIGQVPAACTPGQGLSPPSGYSEGCARAQPIANTQQTRVQELKEGDRIRARVWRLVIGREQGGEKLNSESWARCQDWV